MRIKSPNHYDASKLQRIYEYLMKTQDYYVFNYPEAKQSTYSSLGGCKA